MRNNEESCAPGIWYRLAYYGVYDPIERDRLLFGDYDLESLRDFDFQIVYALAERVLGLSTGLPDAIGTLVRRGATDREDIGALLQLTKSDCHSKSGDGEALKDIASRFLYEHQWGDTGWRTWEGDGREGSTLYGYFGKGLRRAIVVYQAKGVLQGDPSWPRWLVLPNQSDVIDYLREGFVRRSSRLPDLESYEGNDSNDVNRAFRFEIADRNGTGEPRSLTVSPKFERIESEGIRSLRYREVERVHGSEFLVAGERLPSRLIEPEAIGWIQTGSIEWSDQIVEDIMVRHDVRRAFEFVYRHGRNWRPLRSHPTPIPPAWVRHQTVLGPKAARDYSVFCARYLDGYDRSEVGAACSLSEK